MQHPFTLTIIVSLLSGSIYADGYYSTPTAGSDFSNGPKMYVGGSIGTVEQDDTCNDPFFKGSCDNQDTTWKAFGGMRVNPMFGGELAYHDLGQSTLSGTTGAGSTASLNNKATGIAASGVGYVPLMPNAEAFGKAGALFWERESNQTNASVSSNSSSERDAGTVGRGSVLMCARHSMSVPIFPVGVHPGGVARSVGQIAYCSSWLITPKLMGGFRWFALIGSPWSLWTISVASV